MIHDYNLKNWQCDITKENNNKNEDSHLLLNKNMVFLYYDVSFWGCLSQVILVILNYPQPLPLGFPDFLR